MGDTKDFTHNCIDHGDYKVQGVFAVNSWIYENECPICSEVKKNKSEKANQERVAQEAIKQRIEQIDRKKLISSLPLRFKKCNFESYEPSHEVQKQIKYKCSQYAELFDSLRELGTSLVLCGNSGTGKTHLAAAIINSICEGNKWQPKFTSAIKITREVKKTYSSNDRCEDDVIASFFKPDLLVIDEVGVQFGTDTEKMILFEILNERYENLKPTILISNLSIESLKKFTGDRVIDRMKENKGKVLIFNWNSARG